MSGRFFRIFRSQQSWIAAWIIALIYTSSYAWMIHHHTAEPYWDQSNYVTKTYSLVDAWRHARWFEKLDPDVYLNAEPAMRPPLMMFMPALLWKRHATAQDMGYAWLAQRMFFLMAGMWVLSKVARNSRWVPAALCVILGSAYFLQLDPSIYLMDLPFASLALLSVSLVFRAMQQRTINSWIFAAGGAIALFLVKPQGAAFIFPFIAMLCMERLIHEVRRTRALHHPRQQSTHIKSIAGAALIMLALVAILLHVIHGHYGSAVKAQYAWGQQGYWNNTLTWPLAAMIFSGLCPGWILIALLLAAIGRVWITPKTTANRPPPLSNAWGIAVTFCIALLFWLIFTVAITYAIDPRITWSIMPLTVCALWITLWRIQPNQWFGRAATALAAILFLVSCTVTLFGWPAQQLPVPPMLAGPPVTHQHPVSESGERELVRRVNALLHAETSPPPNPNPAVVTVLMCQPYAEYSGMTLAARWENHDQWSSISYQQFPFGDDGFDIANEFDRSRVSWFLTRTGTSPDSVSARSLVNMRAMEALIVDPASPIHELFEPLDAIPVHTPMDTATTQASLTHPNFSDPNAVIVWHLTRPLTAREMEKSAEFIQHFYKGGVGEERMTTELHTLQAIATQGTAIHLINEATADQISDAVAHDVSFAGGLTLKRLRIVRRTKTPGIAIHVEMVWKAETRIELLNNRFLHVNDAAGKIIAQTEAPQDTVHGTVDAGTCWLDTVPLTPAQLRGAVNIGIGIQQPDGQLLPITPAHGATLDWTNHRLIVPLPQK